MYSKDETDILRGKLQALCSTKILANDNAEFGKMISYPSLASNSMSNILKGDNKAFFVHSLFHELESVVLEKTEGIIVLDTWLDCYKQTSAYYELRKTFWKNDTLSKCHAFFEYILFKDHDNASERNTRWDAAWEDAEGVGRANLKILLLMALHILPFYSGKGKLVDNPYDTLKDFVASDPEVKDFGILNALLANEMEINDRLKAIVTLKNVVDKIRSSFGIQLLRDIHENLSDMDGAEVGDGDLPTLWYDGKNEGKFWYFVPAQDSTHFLYEIDHNKRTYTKYYVFFGSEFGKSYGRILHPLLMFNMLNEEDSEPYYAIIRWDKKKNKNGIESISIEHVPTCGYSGEWAKTFTSLTLTQKDTSDGIYQSWAKCMVKGALGWKVSDKFKNTFPGSDYYFALTLNSINYKGDILVDDAVYEDGEWYRDEEKQYFVESKWLGDAPVNFGDVIGVLTMGTDLPETEWKKYLAIDHMQAYYPIVDGEVQFEE